MDESVASVKITSSWNVRNVNGKIYLVEEIIDCKDTFNKAPQYFSPCDDMMFLYGDCNNPTEIIHVDDKKLVLKYQDIETKEFDVLTLKRIQ